MSWIQSVFFQGRKCAGENVREKMCGLKNIQMGVVFYLLATLGGIVVAVVVEFIFEVFEMIARLWQPRLATPP